MRSCVVAVALVAAALTAEQAQARPLAAIKERGAIAACAHANSLPFANKAGDPPGFQVELAKAIADQLGVSLVQNWVIHSFQARRADCDIIMDAIADEEAQEELGLKLSKPYQLSGVALAVRPDLKNINSFNDLNGHVKVGVLLGSLAQKKLADLGVYLVPDIAEDDLIKFIGTGEADAAAITPATIGYYNLTHPDKKLRIVYAYEGDPELSWNVAVGMLRPDKDLIQAINGAVDKLLADGTIKAIYARYGVELRPTKK